MNLGAANAEFAVLKALADAVATRMGELRATHTATLVATYAETGVKAYDVTLPGLGVVATVVVPIPSASVRIHDTAALAEWASRERPALVERVEVPATEAHVATRLRPKVTETLGRLCVAGDGGAVIDPASGEVVPGVHRAADAPDRISVRYPPGGRQAIEAAYRAGELDATLADALPTLARGETS